MKDIIDSYFKIRENYDAYCLEKMFATLGIFQLFIFKHLDSNKKLTENYSEHINKLYLSNKEKIVNFNSLSKTEKIQLKKCIDTINRILTNNGIQIELIKFIEFEDYLDMYPIPLENVNKHYSFEINNKWNLES